MPYLLPDDLDPDVFKCLTIRIPDDPQWETVFWGALTEITYWFNHDRDPAHKAAIVAKKWREWIDDAMSCNTITGITIVNNRLLVQYCNSDVWVTVGPISTIPIRYSNGKIEYDVDLNNTFSVSQYINSQQNIYGGGLPVTDDNDRFCRAAWIMARAMADDYADMIQLIDTNITRVLTRGVQLIAAALVPYTGWAELTESSTEQITDSIKSWLAGTARDEETIRKVAELLFCSIRDHYPNDLNDVIKDLDLGAYEPLGGPLQSIYFWENFGAIAEIAYNTAIGMNQAYIILAYAKISESAFIQFLGLSTPVEASMLYALGTAEHFDSRDCGGFPCMGWTHELNFSTEALILLGFPEGLMLNSGCQIASWIGPDQRRQTTEFRVAPFPVGGYGITKVTAYVTTQEETWEAFLLDYEGGPILDSDTTHTAGDNTRVLEPPTPITGLWFWVASQIQGNSDCPAFFSITVTIEGNGENPFE